MEGVGGSPLTPPPPSKDVDDAALALTKRARKRSRYLSPPYADADVQEVEVAVPEVEEEEPPPPDLPAGEALSSLRATALRYGQAVDPAVLRFLTLYRNRNTTRATAGIFDGDHDSRAAAAGGGGGVSNDDGSNKLPSLASTGGGGPTVLSFSAGTAIPRPDDGSPYLAKKKKMNHQAPLAAKRQCGPMQNAAALGQAADGHIWASKSSGFAVHGVSNPVPQERKKRKKRMKRAGHEQQHFRNPAALVLDFAEGTRLPSRKGLISTFRRFGFVIDSETAIAGDKRSARVAFATRDEAEVAYSCACAGSISSLGPPYVVLSLQDLPPIISSAPPPVPKLPLTDIRSNLEMMISSLKRRSSSSQATAAAVNSPEEAMPAMGNLMGEMQCLLTKVDKMLQGPSATGHHR
nr:unnamed protein product [Digitaria exilis]